MSPKQAAACDRPVDELLDPQWFKALCDPTRLSLVGCLVKCGRPASVSEIAQCCAVDLSVVSRHLRVLERAGLVEATKAGRTVHYNARYAEFCRTLRALADAIEQCCPTGEGVACSTSRGCREPR